MTKASDGSFTYYTLWARRASLNGIPLGDYDSLLEAMDAGAKAAERCDLPNVIRIDVGEEHYDADKKGGYGGVVRASYPVTHGEGKTC